MDEERRKTGPLTRKFFWLPILLTPVHRWKMTPFAHPEMPAVERWYMALNQRPAFMRHGNNGMA